jgi:hypothetical protein
MKVKITMRVTNKKVNELVRFMEPNLENISTYLHTIYFDTKEPLEWLKPERKKEFEDKYNEELSDGNIYYIVDEISIINE